MLIKLENYQVKIKDQLTWGDKEEIQNVYIKGAKIDQTGMKDFDASVISEAKYVLLENAILEIKKGEEVIPFTRDWMKKLSIEDGDKIFDAVEKLNNPKKKD